MPPWLTVLGAAAGAAAIAWGLLRVLAPKGTPLILWQTTAAEAAEFRRVASVIAGVLPGARVVGVSSVADINRAIAAVPGKLGPVVLVGHGTTRTFFPGFGVTPEALARVLAPRLATGAIVGLAGCRAGGDPGSADWEAASFGPGGSRSFAALLRDALVIAGAPWGVEVRAHSTTGGAAANPAARAFPVSRSQIGQPGESALDRVLGAGAWADDAVRRRWTSAVRGDVASLWIAGYDLPARAL